MAEFGFVEYFGADGGHSCGYCKSASGFVTHRMWAHRLTVQNLQDLTDRGWRRSGKYCYKPTMDKMCCPLYIIRCHAPQLEISKSQKKVVKRLHKYLLTGVKRGNASIAPADGTVAMAAPTGPTPAKKQPRPGVGPDPAKPPCRKAKEIRKERRKLKVQLQLGEEDPLTSTPAGELSVSSQVASDQPSGGNQSEIAETPTQITSGATAGTSDSETTRSKDGKKSLEELLMLPSSDGPLCHKLEIRLVRSHPRSAEFDERYKESYALYRKYQMAIHKDTPDKCSESSFTRFLLDSPLVPEPGPKEWECGYGSYHQWYILDGKLIMVGVLDVLPSCLSSKYMFYDPDYDFLNLGVLSALTEMALVRRLHRHSPDLQYYCMGYYVHDCQKMRYKGQYFPSFLLCPETYDYVPIDQCRPKLDVSKYSRLCEEEEAQPHSSPDSYLDTLVLFQNQAMPYQVLCAIHGSRSESKVKEYSSLVGPAVASKCLLFVQ